jgi:hypothetical protein
MRAALWSLTFLAVADFLDLSQMSAEVVAETAGQLVDALFFDQPVGVVVGERVGGVVFIAQRGKAQGLVVLVAHDKTLGVLASDRQATGVAVQRDDLALRSTSPLGLRCSA